MRNLASPLMMALALTSALDAAVPQERVDPIPFGPEAVVEALSPFTADPDSSRAGTILSAEAKTSGFPHSDYDHVLAARLWRLAGEPDLALQALESVAPTRSMIPLAMYEKAKIWFEAGNDVAGSKAYWSACAMADTAVRAEIFWDLLPVTTPAEREAWPSVDGPALCGWLHAFWGERAVRMAVLPDERLGLHFRRRDSARNQFYIGEPRYLEGMSDSFGRPAGLAVDDRGLLLVRLGTPDYEQSCPEEVPPPGKLRNLLGRCWVYWRPEGYKIFYLSTRDPFGRDWPFGDYRIQESLSQQAEPGTHLFQKYVMNADLPETTKRAFVQRGPHYRNAKLGLAGFVTEIPDPLGDVLDRAEHQALRFHVRDATRRFTSEALEQIPDVPEVESTVGVRFESLRFLNPSAGRWQVWLLASARAGDLAPSTENGDADEAVGAESLATLDAGGHFGALTEEGVRIEQLSPQSVPASAVGEDAGITLRGVVTASPGPLPVTLVVEDLNTPGTGAWIQDTVNVPAIGGLPHLSDIAVAQRTGGVWTRDGVTFLQVSPAHITNADGSIHTYFEVYGVRSGTEYDVELRLAPEDEAERIWRLEPGDLAFRLRFTAEMPDGGSRIGRHHLRLDLAETQPGEYTLGVRIQDAETEAYSLPAATPIFVAER